MSLPPSGAAGPGHNGTLARQPQWPGGAAAATDVAGDRAAHALDALATRPQDSIALSVRIPFCTLHCLFCDRRIHATQPAEQLDAYVDGLVAEAALLARRIGADRDVLQLHLGGGTANELSGAQLSRLVHALQRAWRMPAETRMSIECDPRRVGWGELRTLRALGLRQVTYGVLDLDPRVQRTIGKLASAALVDDVCELSRASGIETIQLKLMVGLPHQSLASWRATVSRLIAMAPDRIMLAQYRHQPCRVPTQQLFDAASLPGPALREQLSTSGARWLCEAGYRRIGAQLFVLDSDELAVAFEQRRLGRNLISYTATPPAPVLGLGVGAVGEVDDQLLCSDPGLADWHATVRSGRLPLTRVHTASRHELRRRAAQDHLLCRLELPLALAQGGLEDAYARLARHVQHAWVHVLHDRIVVTGAGQDRLEDLCAALQPPAWGDGSRPVAPLRRS